MDDFADKLLNEERVCDIQLPRLTQRRVLEDTEGLPKRKSKLAAAMGVTLESDDESEDERKRGRRSASGSDRFVSRSPSRSSGGSPDRYVSRSPSRSPSPGGNQSDASMKDGDRYISRSPTPEA
jgi:pre-mRNA-splicing factor 38A